MTVKSLWRISALIALPILLFGGIKLASDKRDARAIEGAVRGGNGNTGRFPDALRSSLDVRLVPLQTTIQPQPHHGKNGVVPTLILPVRLENYSAQTLKFRLSHEWYGGRWPPTDLFAYLPENGSIAPVYLAGERGSSPPTILAPGASTRLDLRMNWPGTGSVRGAPIMDDSATGDYQLRLLLMLGTSTKSRYITGQKMRIHVAVD